MTQVNIHYSERLTPEQIRNEFYDIKVLQALGYLSTWNQAARVDIFIDSDFDMTAHYYRQGVDTQGEFKHFYTIGGIRNSTNGVYSFHS